MAQTATVHPLPDTGRNGSDERAWLHDLTPTLSDSTMFDVEGCVQPLAALPSVSMRRRTHAPMRLVMDQSARAAATHRSVWR